MKTVKLQFCKGCGYYTRPVIRDIPQRHGIQKENIDYDEIVCNGCQEVYFS